MIEPREFRNVLGRFPTGVTVVTMLSGETSYGLTVNAFMSVSLEPPLVAVSIGKGSKAHATLMKARRYGVSILSEQQRQVSDFFAGRPVRVPDPFTFFDGFPVVSGSQAQLVCRISARHDAGDHTIFVGEVDRLRYAEGSPLLFHRGRYGRLEEEAVTA